MCDKTDFVVCRLCLNSGGRFINIFHENNNLEFMLEKTIEDLINVKVVEDKRYPWLVCSTCVEKLTEFRLFKHRCIECLSVFYHRIQKGCNPATKDWITNRKEFPVGIRKEFGADKIIRNATQIGAVDVRDKMNAVKEEVDAISDCSAAKEKDTDASIVPSMQDRGSYRLDNEDLENLDCSEDRELQLSFNEEVDIKEDCDIDILQEERGLGDDVSRVQDGDKEHDLEAKVDKKKSLHTCQICNKVFADSDILKAHVMHVHLKRSMQIRCELCSDVFKDRSDLEEHVKFVHALKNKHQSQQCSRNVRNQSELRNHALTHTDEKLFNCTNCFKAFSRKRNLEMHMLTHTGERSYKCELCSEGFIQKSHLESHMLSHEVKKQHKCTVCLRVFARKEDVSRHMKVHTRESSHKCALCLRVFASKTKVRRHILTHTGERPHRCELCPKTFALKQTLKAHIGAHSREKLYKCQECPKVFSFKKILKEHMQIHSGEKPLKCNICSEAFSDKSNLNTHISTHSEDNQYKCALCLKGFSKKVYLRRHTSTHTGNRPNKCKICSKAFLDKANLRRHMMTHTSERPHKCPLCSKSFKHKFDLKRHNKIHKLIVTN